MLTKIRSARDGLSRSEQKVADVVLEDPEGMVNLSIQAVAAMAGVSEPTVIRFCRAIDCSGWQKFKMRVAQELASRNHFFYRQVKATDTSVELAGKLIDSTMAAMVQVRNQFNHAALDAAIEMYERCERLELYGSGGSAIVAEDAQLKFFRLGKPAIAYSDPHIQQASAALLDERSMLIAISHSGRSHDILDAVDLARHSGAQVLAVTAALSPLAERSHINLSVDVVEDSDLFAPVKSRLAQMLVLDILAVGIAVRGGQQMLEQLARARHAIDRRFVEPDRARR